MQAFNGTLSLLRTGLLFRLALGVLTIAFRKQVIHDFLELLLPGTVLSRWQPWRVSPLFLQLLGLAGSFTHIGLLGQRFRLVDQGLPGRFRLFHIVFQLVIQVRKDGGEAFLHLPGIGEPHRLDGLPILRCLLADLPDALPVCPAPVLGTDKTFQLFAKLAALFQILLAQCVLLGEMGLAGLIGTIGGCLEPVPEGLVLILIRTHQGPPFVMKRLDGRCQLRGIHGAVGKGFHGFTQRDFLGLSSKPVPVLQFGASRFQLLQLVGQRRITAFLDNGLGLVPEPVGVAQIAFTEFPFQGNQQPLMGAGRRPAGSGSGLLFAGFCCQCTQQGRFGVSRRPLFSQAAQASGIIPGVENLRSQAQHALESAHQVVEGLPVIVRRWRLLIGAVPAPFLGGQGRAQFAELGFPGLRFTVAEELIQVVSGGLALCTGGICQCLAMGFFLQGRQLMPAVLQGLLHSLGQVRCRPVTAFLPLLLKLFQARAIQRIH